MKFFNVSLAAIILSLSAQAIAQDASWIGGITDNDMLNNLNWNGGVPTGMATFQSGTTTPNLLGPGSTFELGTFHFPATSTESYSVTVSSNPSTGTTSYLIFNDVGVQVDNNHQQTFTANNNGQIDFTNSASASAGSGTRPVIYNVNFPISMGQAGSVNFTNSSVASNAIFNIASSAYVQFFDSTSAENATFNTDGLLYFYDTSTPASSTIYSRNGAEVSIHTTAGNDATMVAQTGGYIEFLDSASMGSANMTAETNGVIDYQSNAPFTTGTATVNLLTGGELYLGAPATNVLLASLAGDSSSLVDLNATTLITGYNNKETTFAGFMVGSSGGFAKAGKGKFTFSGMGVYSGPTNVLQGKYILNGKLNDSAVTVSPNATIKGSGTVANGSLTVYGKIAPGNSIDTITVINGPYTQGSGSTYVVEIDSAESDLINVIGIGSVATIDSNTTVKVSSLDGTFLVGPQHNYLILHADDGVVGTYTKVIQNVSLFVTPSLSYDPIGAVTDVYLSLATNFSPFARSNQLCIASQLDTLAITPLTLENQAVLSALAASPSVKAFQNALDLISGEQYTYLNQLSSYSDYRFGRRLFSSIREFIRPKNNHCCDCGRNYETWIRAEYDYAYGRSHENVGSLRDNSWDVSAGAHGNLLKNFILGFAGNYSQDYVNFNRDHRTSTIQSAQGALYGLFNVANFYLFSNLIVGESWSKNFKRYIEFGSLDRVARSRPNIFHGKGYLEIGAEFCLWDILFEPFFGVDGGWYTFKRTVEHGAGLLNRVVHKQQNGYWATNLGLHLLDIMIDSFKLGGDLYWQHRYHSFGHNLSTSFEDFGTPCGLEGNQFGHDGVIGTLNASNCLSDRMEAYIEINGQYWERFASGGATIGFNLFW